MPMDELTTDRLIIRGFAPDDWKDLYDYQYDPAGFIFGGI
jgi:hypothetical protein